MPTNVISTKGCFKNNGALLKKMGNRCLIITGESSAITSGAFADAEKVLKDSSIEYIVYNKIKATPLLSSCFEAGAMARKFRADFIIGIGGGSCMDCAKVAAIFAGNSSFTPLDIYKREIQKALPVVVVGTTAGTGSEVNSKALLIIDEQNTFKCFENKLCYPTVSFCDPTYTASCPYDLTVSTALDALSHAVEGFFSRNCGDIARNSALNAVNLIWPNLLWLRDHVGSLPDENIRTQLYYGSLWAGFTLNLCGTCFPHLASYPLTSEFNIPHGKAVGLFLPYFVEKNYKFSPSISTLLFSVAGCDADNFCKTLKTFTKAPNISMTAEQIQNFTSNFEDNEILSNSVVPTTAEEIRSLYQNMFLQH